MGTAKPDTAENWVRKMRGQAQVGPPGLTGSGAGEAITGQKREDELSEPAHWEPCSLGDG